MSIRAYFTEIFLIPLLATGVAAQEQISSPHQQYREAKSVFESRIQGGDREGALLALREMVRLHPAEESTRFQLSLLLLKSYPKNPVLRKARLKEALSLLHDSILIWEDAGTSKEELARRYFYYAMVLWFLGRGDMGRDAMSRAIVLHPAWEEAQFNLSAMEEELGESASK